MIRTQISLEPAEYKLVKQQAKNLGVSIAEVIRRAVRDSLPAAQGASWMRYAGFIESGDSNSSRSIDEVVYGAKD